MRLVALACALCAPAVVLATAFGKGASAADTTRSTTVLVARISHYQHVAWHWQAVMGVKRTPSSFVPARSTDPAYQRWVGDLWQRRAIRFRLRAQTWMAAKIRSYRAAVDHWQRVMGVGAVRETASAGSGEAAFVRWRRLARTVLRRAASPPYESAWRCIHRYEGSWRDADGPYYGGLQMDLTFQQHYGRYLLQTKGTADHWTPLEQMWVAARAHRSGRGFFPWPSTARVCGLI
jgi:hypothetical protein